MTRRIELVYETIEDAEKTGKNLSLLKHWREPGELEQIREAVEKAGYQTRLIGSPSALLENMGAIRKEIDFIFNLSVGFITRYRLGIAPALYSLTGIPYSGADPFTKIVTQNKHILKSFWDKTGIPTPEWAYFENPAGIESTPIPEFPLIVKPAHEGTSIGIAEDSVVNSMAELRKRVGALFDTLRMPVIAERFIAGQEIKVGMIGDNEIVFEGMAENLTPDGKAMGGGFLHFDLKSGNTGTFGLVERNSLKWSNIIEDCRKIYRSFLPVDFGTFDIRIDGNGNYYFLEFNTDATLHPGRTMSRVCGLNGLDYDSMIGKILAVSFARWGL